MERKTIKKGNNYILTPKTMQEYVYIDNEQRLRFDEQKLINYIGELENICHNIKTSKTNILKQALYEMAERVKYFEEMQDKEYGLNELFDIEYDIDDIVELYIQYAKETLKKGEQK